jgi:transposase
MLGLPPSVRIYFATELVDMRNGIDGLRAVVEAALKKDAYQGHLFVFVGKSKDKVKILFWDRNGFVLYLNQPSSHYTSFVSRRGPWPGLRDTRSAAARSLS